MADLFDILTESGKRKLAAPAYVKKIKTAGPLRELATKNPMLAGAILGAVAATSGQYAANRAPRGGFSLQQKLYGRAERVSNEKEHERKVEGREPSMTEEVGHITAKPLRQLADVAAKHPMKAALVAAPVGAKLGVTLAKLFAK